MIHSSISGSALRSAPAATSLGMASAQMSASQSPESVSLLDARLSELGASINEMREVLNIVTTQLRPVLAYDPREAEAMNNSNAEPKYEPRSPLDDSLQRMSRQLAEVVSTAHRLNSVIRL